MFYYSRRLGPMTFLCVIRSLSWQWSKDYLQRKKGGPSKSIVFFSSVVYWNCGKRQPGLNKNKRAMVTYSIRVRSIAFWPLLVVDVLIPSVRSLADCLTPYQTRKRGLPSTQGPTPCPREPRSSPSGCAWLRFRRWPRPRTANETSICPASSWFGYPTWTSWLLLATDLRTCET